MNESETTAASTQEACSLHEVDSWLVQTLKAQAKEIAAAGHNGWGNTMLAAAEEIEHHRSENRKPAINAVRVK